MATDPDDKSGDDEVDKDQLENLLQCDLVTINDLRDTIDRRDLNVKSNRTEKLVEAILSDTWTTDEFEQLKENLAQKQAETEPKGRWIQAISSIDKFTENPLHEEIEQRLKNDEAEIVDNTVVEDGFEITDTDDKRIKGVHWSQNTSYVLGPFNKLRSRQSLYNIPFSIDVERDLVRIGADRFGKARGFSADLRDKSMELDPVGHHHLLSDEANEKVEAFVDDLKEELRSEADNQQTEMHEFSDSDSSDLDSPVKIDMVNVKVESGELKEVRIGGRADIFGIETVENLKSDRDGKIAKIKGEMLYCDEFFKFTVGYNEIAGRVMVRKKGRAKGDAQLVDDAYDLVYELYDEYFISP